MLATPALAFLAVAWTASFIALSAADGLLGWDLRFAYLPAADAIRHGLSPYPGLHDQVLLDQKGYVYPPQLAILRVLGIRDWRCYAVAILWLPSMSGIGYREIARVLRGHTPLDEAVAQLKHATHQYAKRQMTWFRKEKGAVFVKPPYDAVS